ncbi:MAG: hypothetical protein HDT30_07685 [Clostridiales bacterium]|nr:hypothetical protein [Clostridiales bacterium]
MSEMDYVYGKAAIGICIEKIDKDVFWGTVHTPYHKEDNIFHDVVELLLLLDEISEERGFPNAMYKNRTLKEKVASKKNVECGRLLRTKEQMDKSYEEEVTYILYITSRKHGSLQGHMICLGTGSMIKYQSELELVYLMEKHWQDATKKENMKMVL